jgi:ADP-ribosylglycohydrolase
VDDVTTPREADRFLGCLLGLAIGDALGMPAASRDDTTPIAGYEPLRDSHGAIVEPAGEFTSHTELALCLVESVVSSNGFVDPDAAGFRFVQVLHGQHAHFLDPTTRAALERASETGKYQHGLAGGGAVEPGPAARVVPVGLVHALGKLNVELLVREVMRATLITHADPLAVNGALALAYAVNIVTRREVLPEMLPGEVLAFIDEDDVARKLRVVGAALSSSDTPGAPGQFVLGDDIASAVANAIFCFVKHHHDFQTAVLAAANAGAAVGAMTGALAGAWTGAQALPIPLIEGLEGRMYILMAAPALYRTAQRRAGLFLQLHQRP